MWASLKLAFGWYAVVIVLASLTCILLTLLGITFGTHKRYLRLLELIFQYAVHFCSVHEEDTDSGGLASEPSQAVLLKQTGLIHRDAVMALRAKLDDTRVSRTTDDPKFLQLVFDDVADYIMAGAEVIIEDEVTSSFAVEELPSWNLLTRTKSSYTNVSWRIKLVWYLGFFFRYALLVPVRSILLGFGLVFMGFSALAAIVLENSPVSVERKVKFGRYATITGYRLLGRCASLVTNFHDEVNAPKPGEGAICVANHTSPIDVLVLNTHLVYALTGQKHKGMLGYLENVIYYVTPTIWFERADRDAREKVVRTLRDYANDPAKPPVLIFPEGVCVNNTSTMQFRKGTFEATDKVFPVAMKYQAQFGDPFWSQDLWLEHIWCMLTSWAIVCDVWYLPVMQRLPEEASSDFARRVKAAISEAAGLRFLAWDGFLKQYTVVKAELIEHEKQKYSRRLQKHIDSEHYLLNKEE